MALTYQVAEVQLVTVNGNTYRLVSNTAGCDILQRLNHWDWRFVNDNDELSLSYSDRTSCETAAIYYREAVDAAGGESPPFVRDVYVAQGGRLRWKGQVTGVSSVPGSQGVRGKVYDPLTGVLGDNEITISNVTMLPVDELGAATQANADAALADMANAQAALAAAQATVDTYGGQLSAHAGAVLIPDNEEIDNVERVRLEALLSPGA